MLKAIAKILNTLNYHLSLDSTSLDLKFNPFHSKLFCAKLMHQVNKVEVHRQVEEYFQKTQWYFFNLQWKASKGHHLSKDALGELMFEIGPVILKERMLF